MGTKIMGKVLVPARVENLSDVSEVENGFRPADAIRSVEIPDALVDTGATLLSMPKRYIDQLGMKPRRTRRARTAGRMREFNVYHAVRLTVQDRDCLVEVSELPDDCPVLIGQIPLEAMDWVVEPKGQRLMGNPEHDGHWMMDIY